MFKPDKYGSTFFFVDMDYSNDTRHVDNGISLGYWEISRSFKWNKTQKFEPRLEYNGGNLRVDNNFAVPINNAWLVGGQYTFNNADYSKILTLQANYKHIKGAAQESSFQLTAVWGVHLMKGKLSLTGFADLWKQTQFGGDFVFLAEPQIWYNACDNFSFGGEIELSNNFATVGFSAKPTLAVKWTF